MSPPERWTRIAEALISPSASAMAWTVRFPRAQVATAAKAATIAPSAAVWRTVSNWTTAMRPTSHR